MKSGDGTGGTGSVVDPAKSKCLGRRRLFDLVLLMTLLKKDDFFLISRSAALPDGSRSPVVVEAELLA